MATTGNFTQQDQYKATSEQPQVVPTTASDASTAGATTSNSNLSKDEVGWYFVEQYYTTLSKSPEKLHVRNLPLISCCDTNPFSSSSTASARNLSTVSRQKLPTSPLADRYVHTLHAHKPCKAVQSS